MKLARICRAGIRGQSTHHTPLHSCQHQKLRLEQVQVLFRHGARTPVKSQHDFEKLKNYEAVTWDADILMKTPPHLDVEFVLNCMLTGNPLQLSSYPRTLLGGCNGGDLTVKGQLEGYEFGRWLAQEYISKHGLLSASYENDGSLYVRSTHTQRTVLTARGVVTGLYGKENIQHPIQMYTKVKRDEIHPNWSECFKLNQRLLHYWDMMKDGQRELNELMGLEDNRRPWNFIEIYDVIAQSKHHGLFVPDYLLEREKFISEQALILMMEILGQNLCELRNSIGSFVDLLCSELDTGAFDTNERKMILYASHDTTLLCVQKVLGIFKGEWPGYVSSIIFELYTDEVGNRYVRVLCDKDPVVWAGGKEVLPLEEFLNLVDDYRVLDWDEDCGNNNSGVVIKPPWEK